LTTSSSHPQNPKVRTWKRDNRSATNVLPGYGPALTPKILLDFTNAGGNTLLALSANSPTPAAISSLLLELEIHLSPDRTSVVVDHFNYDASSAAEKHDVLLVQRPKPLRPDVKNYFGGDGVLAVPRAVGQTLGNESPLLAPILTAPETAYSYNPKEEGESIEDPFATGGQLALISAMQARNSARFTILGSLEMLADQWFGAIAKGADGKAKKTVNKEFAKQLSAWAFKETGVLKVGHIDHYEIAGSSKKGENTSQVGHLNPAIYRIKNDVVKSHSFFSLQPSQLLT
jgi:oligosaccharyltransferase complex subunit beta